MNALCRLIKYKTEACRGLWDKACGYEHIPSNSKFVCFSPSNINAIDYNAMMLELLNLRRTAVLVTH